MARDGEARWIGAGTSILEPVYACVPEVHLPLQRSSRQAIPLDLHEQTASSRRWRDACQGRPHAAAELPECTSIWQTERVDPSRRNDSALEDGLGSGRPTLYVPLDKPPTAFSLTVRKVLGRVQAGEIRVPSFQRPLRWNASEVVKLFDSILKGYPIGSLLFWKHSFPADAELPIGSARISAPAVADGWFIVDGQQRTTALAAALLDLDQRGDPRWAIYFDPATNAFFSKPPGAAEIGEFVPLSALGDIRRLGKWFRTCQLSEDEQSRVEDVQQRLLDYEIPGYLMETDDIDALRGVFARLNSTGVRMRADEVFQALLGTNVGSEHGGQSGKIDLATLQRECDLDSFGSLPRPEALKALLAMSGIDPSKRLEDLGEHAAATLVGASDAIEALRRTVAFLQAPVDAPEPGAGIPAYAFIPYPVVFVLLARWFHLFPEPDPTTRRELSRWLWRGVATGVHQRAAVSAMRRQVREIQPEDMDGSLRRLLAAVGEPVSREWSLEKFHANHAASRVEILTLLSRIPRDRVGPVSWQALVSTGERVAREIARSESWKSLSTGAKELARTAANRALLDARHSGLSVEFLSWSWEADREALESHLIDEPALTALEEDIDGFLTHRAARLRTEVASFLAHRTGLGEPRLFPVASYYEPDSLDL